jgi:hypothetical protein
MPFKIQNNRYIINLVLFFLVMLYCGCGNKTKDKIRYTEEINFAILHDENNKELKKISLEEADKMIDSLTILNAKEQISRGNLILSVPANTIDKRVIEVLKEDYNIYVFENHEGRKDGDAFNLLMVNEMAKKYGKRFYLEAQKKAEYYNRILPSYLNIDSTYNDEMWQNKDFETSYFIKDDKFLYDEFSKLETLVNKYIKHSRKIIEFEYIVDCKGDVSKPQIIYKLFPELDTKIIQIFDDFVKNNRVVPAKLNGKNVKEKRKFTYSWASVEPITYHIILPHIDTVQ